MEPMVWDGERNRVIFGSDGLDDGWDDSGICWGESDNDWDCRGDGWDGRGDVWDGSRGEKFFAPTIGESLIIIIP